MAGPDEFTHGRLIDSAVETRHGDVPFGVREQITREAPSMHEKRWPDASSEMTGEPDGADHPPRFDGPFALPLPLFWLAILLAISALAATTMPGMEDSIAKGLHERALLHTSRIDGVAFSPDSRLVATGSSDGAMKVYDLATHRERPIGDRGSKGCTWVAFSPVDRTVASGSFDGRVTIANLSDGRSVCRFEAISAGYSLRCGLFAPDGRSLATGGDDRIVRIWDTRTGLPLLAATGHTDTVRGLAFTPDGNSVLSVAADGLAILRDARTGQIRERYDPNTGPLWSVAISGDGRWAALGGRDGITLRNLADGRSIAHRSPEGPITSLGFLPTGTMMASGGFKRPVTLWSWQGGMLRQWRTLDGDVRQVKALAVSPDGKVLAAGGGDGVLNVWSL